MIQKERNNEDELGKQMEMKIGCGVDVSIFNWTSCNQGGDAWQKQNIK